MDRNFILAIALSFLVLTTWSMYTSTGERAEAERQAAEAERRAAGAPQSPGAPDPDQAAVPLADDGSFAPAPSPSTATPSPAPTAAPAAPRAPEERIVVSGDLWEAEFSSHGGTLERWVLQNYDDASRPGRPQVEITTPDPIDPNAPRPLATPFLELGAGDLSRAAYTVDQPDPNTIVFTRTAGGVRITKTYTLDPTQYELDLRILVENGTDRYVRSTFRALWPAVARDSADFKEFMLGAFSNGSIEQAPVTAGPSFLGFGGGSFEGEITYPEERPADLDWAGAQMRYFVAALIPDVPREAAARFTSLRAGEAALAELAYNPIDLPPGQRAERGYRIYLGPKEPELLDAVGAHLDEAILKGWFPALTRFFTWALTTTQAAVGNYGIAIVIITVLVRLLMAPIMTRQMKSMKRLSELQPKIKEVQEKFPDDRQKQSEAMMAVYKEAGVSPFSAMAGCFPMLLQLPVFIGFYYALQGAISLRQQPFFGWITDLSEPEQLFVIPGLELPVRLLPLLMGGSMVLQQRLTPTAMDPAQARMMLIVMPIMFTVLFYQFASGLVLYWLVSNLLGIGQQYLTNRSKD